ILPADGGTEHVVGLFAGSTGAGGLYARDQKVQAAHIAAEDRQLLHGALRHGVGDVGLFSLEQRGFGGGVHRLVDPDDQVALGVVGGFVGDGIVGDAFSRVGNHYLGIRDNRSAGIDNVSGNASVDRLPEERFGGEQGRRAQTKRESSHA